MQKLIGHGQNVFQKDYSTDLLPNALHISSRHLDKDTHSTMAWYIDANDPDFSLYANKKLVEIDIAKILINQFTILEESYNISLIKWDCSRCFLFEVLPMLCLWFAQDGIFYEKLLPTHITTLLLYNKFPRYRE